MNGFEKRQIIKLKTGMKLQKHSCRRLAAAVFLISALGSNYILHSMNYSNMLSLAGGLFLGVVTAGIWLEVGYRFLVKEATAPLDNLIKKL